MSRDLEGAVLLVLGVVVARVTLEGSYLAYVKQSLFWPLVLTSLVLFLLGFATMRRQSHSTTERAAQDSVDGMSVAEPHGHRPPRSGMLLLFPIIVLVLAAPAPLGAFAAGRGSVNNLADDVADDLPPLEQTGSDPVELSISEFVLRTHADGAASVRGIPVKLTGFVADHGDADAFLLSRFAIACCAADASPRQILVQGGISPEEDSWAVVIVIWDGSTSDEGGDSIPVVLQQQLDPITPPAQPYEYAAY